MSATQHLLRLADGRTIGYAEYGDPSGAPILYFHGWPGNHHEWRLFDVHDTLGRQMGLRVIAWDRPGYLRSDPRPHASLLDLAKDVRQIIDQLSLGNVTLLAYSGGGPAALATAACLGAGISGVVLVACAGPFDTHESRRRLMGAARMQYWLARRLPALYRTMNAQLVKHPERMVEGMLRSLPEPDAAALRQPAVQQIFMQVTQALGEGTLDGALDDAARNWGRWPFAPAEVKVPVHVWQGGRDVNAPPVIARGLKAALPDCTLHELPEEGHISIVVNHPVEILGCLAPVISR